MKPKQPKKINVIKATAINKHSDQNNRGLKLLNAKLIHLTGDAKSVTRLGKFLLKSAQEMRSNKSYHRHFRDFLRIWDVSMVDVVVERVASKPKKPTMH